jgi:hypothetical protein
MGNYGLRRSQGRDSRCNERQGMTGSFLRRLALAFSLALVTGCATQGSAAFIPASLPAQYSSAAKSGPLLYVANTSTRHGAGYGSVLGFAADATGNVRPAVKISGTNTGLGYFTTSAAVDYSGRLYVSGPNFNSISVWPAGNNGDVKPTASFDVDCDSFSEEPVSFILDGMGNVWVACKASTGTDVETGHVLEYPPVAAGATGYIQLTPIREIVGQKTGMQRLTSIALNAKGQVSVDNTRGRKQPNLILTFAGTANGNVAPLSRLGGDKTELGGDGYHAYGYGGISYDSQGRLVACSNGRIPQLITFAPGARGNVAPTSTLSIQGCYGIALDSEDNLYVAYTNSIVEYAAGSVGSAKPVRTISGNLTTLSMANSLTF